MEGVPNAKSFGVPSNEKPSTSSKTPPTVIPESPKNNIFNSPSSSPLQLRQKEYNVTPTPAKNRKRRRRDVSDTGDVIEMEAKHFSKIVSRNIRKLKKIKEKELQELTRHNHAMEKTAQTKNELKLKFLELQRIKLGIQPSSP